MLRWLVPFCLIAAFIANGLLAFKGGTFLYVFLFQVLFYSLAAFGIIARKETAVFAIKIPRFFVLVNTSILFAWIKYLRGERLTMWNPSVR